MFLPKNNILFHQIALYPSEHTHTHRVQINHVSSISSLRSRTPPLPWFVRAALPYPSPIPSTEANVRQPLPGWRRSGGGMDRWRHLDPLIVGGGVYWRRWQRQIAESISASRQRAAMCSLLVACGGVRRSWFGCVRAGGIRHSCSSLLDDVRKAMSNKETAVWLYLVYQFNRRANDSGQFPKSNMYVLHYIIFFHVTTFLPLLWKFNNYSTIAWK